MRMRPLVPAALVLALAGCISVGPDYQAPEPAPVALPSADAAAFSGTVPVAAWWRQFDDPVLDALMDRAMLANLDVRVAVARVDAARAVFSEQRLDLAPHVPAVAAASRSNAPVFPGQPRVIQEQVSFGFDARWEIDLFGRIRRSIEAADADLGAERAGLEDVRVSIAAEVAGNYFALRGLQRRIEVAEDTLDTLRDTQRLTEVRAEYGAESEQAVQSSLARLREIEASVPALQSQAAVARNRLAVLLGQAPGSLDDLLAPRPLAPFVRPLPIGDTRDLLRQRPDVRAAERRLAAATARVGVATADLFPRVSLTGFLGFLSGSAGDLFESDSETWSIEPSVSWAAFDLGSVRARLRATEADADAALARYEQAVLVALEDTEDALQAQARRQEQLESVVGQAEAARRAAEVAELLYREGAADFLVLLDAQRQQLAAADALARVESDVNVGAVEVYRALGGIGREPAFP
ncbi:efflux transporter outer membrane subunit [Coralloluteibacterium stylophorae]|uniref:TolC family protein n=1 Tax=Coralloluteibacterium stylophorae TaxID=1776034 RepID=A0AAP2FZD2_9GAMM|nr:TolC family protein [Coralloluteibacterium stylophorae]MBS7456436.1 TolC family protein [Coralloluteibacterium stylophorae]